MSTETPQRPIHESEIERNLAEARRFDAEAARFKAEAAEFKAKTLESSIRATNAQIALDREQHKRTKELSADEFHHTYLFDNEVNAASVKACISQLATWSRQDSKCDIEIQINSPGGEIFSGFALIDFVRDLRRSGHHVTTLAIGKAASMGGVILQAGDTRVMGANALMLIHEGSLGAVGDFGEVEDRIALMKLMHGRILDLFAERSKVSKRFIQTHWKRKDWWLTADECLKHGFIDEVR